MAQWRCAQKFEISAGQVVLEVSVIGPKFLILSKRNHSDGFVGRSLHLTDPYSFRSDRLSRLAWIRRCPAYSFPENQVRPLPSKVALPSFGVNWQSSVPLEIPCTTTGPPTTKLRENRERSDVDGAASNRETRPSARSSKWPSKPFLMRRTKRRLNRYFRSSAGDDF